MTELNAYLRAAKSNGASDEFLVALLKEQGWPASAVYAALGEHYAELTGVPVPQARGRMESAREAFFHLLAFATLFTWIFATGSLWFELIDTWFPDAANVYSRWRWSRVSWQMASIIVAFPAFVFATRAILKDADANPDKTGSGVRRWLTNIALLIAALIFIGDLMAFVASFLQGELTARFMLQCLTVFVLAGAVFLYYSRGSAKAGVTPHNWHKGFAMGAAGAIFLSLGLGFLKTGSPAEQRERAEDRRRVEDLFRIAQGIHNEWNRTPAAERKLPESIAAVRKGPEEGLVLSDPFTGAAYEYVPQKDSAYLLCATFATETPVQREKQVPAWSHTVGRYCFDLDAKIQPPFATNWY